MPYANPIDNAARQRARRQEQRAQAEQQQARSTATLPSPPSPPRSAPVSPSSSSSSSRPSPRRQLREQYNVLRHAGLSDTQAQRAITQQREATQRQRRQVEREQQIAALAPRFLGPARAYLAHGGAYREDAVPQVARMMAERSLTLEQQPTRQPAQIAESEMLLLPSVTGETMAVPIRAASDHPRTNYARMAATLPVEAFQQVTTTPLGGQPGRTVRAALGDGRSAAMETLIEQIASKLRYANVRS